MKTVVKQSVRSLAGVNIRGLSAMDNLADWVVMVAAVAVGVCPGLAILCAGSIARLLQRVFQPLLEAVPKPGRDPAHQKPVIVATSPVSRTVG